MTTNDKKAVTDDVDIFCLIPEEPEGDDPNIPVPEQIRPPHQLRDKPLPVTTQQPSRSNRSSSYRRGDLPSDYNIEREMLRTLVDEGLAALPLRLRWFSMVPCPYSDTHKVHHWLMHWRMAVPHLISPVGPELKGSKNLVRRDNAWWGALFERVNFDGMDIRLMGESGIRRKLWMAGLDRESTNMLVDDISFAKEVTRYFEERLHAKWEEWKATRNHAIQQMRQARDRALGREPEPDSTTTAAEKSNSPASTTESGQNTNNPERREIPDKTGVLNRRRVVNFFFRAVVVVSLWILIVSRRVMLSEHLVGLVLWLALVSIITFLWVFDWSKDAFDRSIWYVDEDFGRSVPVF